MRCHRVKKRLAAYQDGEVSGKERERIAAYLEGCPAYRSAYAELEQAWQSLEKILEIQVSPGFERRLSARINAVSGSRATVRNLPGSCARNGFLEAVVVEKYLYLCRHVHRSFVGQL